MRILFRCDSSLSLGTGHVQRCLSLAEALKPYNAEIFFFGLQMPGNIAQQISAKGFHSQLFHSEEELFKEAQKHIWNISVFDNYQVDQETESQWRKNSARILVIDDLANRSHDCDFLLDTNDHGDDVNPYKNLVPRSCQQFLGPTYALLRDEFRLARPKTMAKKLKNRGLIFFGGTDPLSLMPTYYEYLLSEKSLLEKYEFDFLVSSSCQSLNKLKKLPPSPRLHLQIDPPSVAQVMQKSGFYIGSGGTVTWERMHLGLTGVVMAVADNQDDNAKNLDERGCHQYLGAAQSLSPQKVFGQMEVLLKSPEDFLTMSENCYNLVDGSGWEKFLAALTLET